jgi:hypothetical protein
MLLRILTSVFAAFVLPAIATADEYPEPAPGEQIVFDVYRKGDIEFGTHQVTFEREGEAVVARATIRLRAGFGPITAFRYEHDAVERWNAGRLVSLESETLKDGNTYQVTARLDGEQISVSGEDPDENPVSLTLPQDILSSSHWHGYPSEMTQMLNTEHGTVMETEVQDLGMTQIEGDGGMIDVRHIRLSSSLVVDLYYDENGRWAGCEFEARGQTIRYVRRADPVAG